MWHLRRQDIRGVDLVGLVEFTMVQVVQIGVLVVEKLVLDELLRCIAQVQVLNFAHKGGVWGGSLHDVALVHRHKAACVWVLRRLRNGCLHQPTFIEV